MRHTEKGTLARWVRRLATVGAALLTAKFVKKSVKAGYDRGGP